MKKKKLKVVSVHIENCKKGKHVFVETEWGKNCLYCKKPLK